MVEALNQPKKPPNESDPSSTTATLQSSGTPAYTMATAINLPTFSEFEPQPRDTAPTRFEKYVKCLNNMFTAMSITQASKKKAMLLHYVGEETYDVFETLTVPELTGESDEYRSAVKAFVDYFEPHKCVDHHVYMFRQESQKSGENITEFYIRLQMLARKCEFANIYRFGNKTANNSRQIISSPGPQSYREKPQPGGPA